MGRHQVGLKGGHRLRAETVREAQGGLLFIHSLCVQGSRNKTFESELLLGWPRGSGANKELDYSGGEEPG